MTTEVDGILVAAHELKAPLATLRQLALSLGRLSSSDEHLRDEMVQVSEQAIRQVNDLAKIQRLANGAFQMEPVAVREVCDAVAQEVAQLRCESQWRLTTQYHNRARLVSANRELLASVIYNFLTSALHYTEAQTETQTQTGAQMQTQAQVRMHEAQTLAEIRARAKLSVREKDGRMQVLVRDYGPSLPLSVWRAMRDDTIAQPTAIAMRPGSSGLGLYIAAKFSHYMHAKVGAVRHRDGTSFYVELPISQQASLFV